MTYQCIRRVIMVICLHCLGLGYVTIVHGEQRPCPVCKGKGEVEKYITESVHQDEKENP